MYKLAFIFFLLGTVVTSCGKHKVAKGDDFVASFKEEILTRDAIESVIPKGMTKGDSLNLAEAYVKNWLNDRILYDKAKENIASTKEIEEMVENYRQSLIVFQYQQQLFREKVNQEISEEEVSAYYEANGSNLVLDESIICGLFLKIPSGAPALDKLRTWYVKPTSDNLEKIEKYSIQNASEYDYFFNRWVAFADLVDKMPVSFKDNEAFLRNNKSFETSDSLYHYFLYVEDYCLSGNKAPLQYVEASIREKIMGQRRKEFFNEFMEKLYERESKNIELNK